VPVKSKVKISQKFVAFSEYMNFTTSCYPLAALLKQQIISKNTYLLLSFGVLNLPLNT
jgi:hypothetical protein